MLLINRDTVLSLSTDEIWADNFWSRILPRKGGIEMQTLLVLSGLGNYRGVL